MVKEMRKQSSFLWLPVVITTAVCLGSFIGYFSPDTGISMGGFVDTIIKVLVFMLFFEVSFSDLLKASSNVKFLCITWVSNFIVLPVLGYVIAALFLHSQSALFIGLVIYFMAPCTDWFLGFTRATNGNTKLGAIWLPISMISQLILFPVYIFLFARHSVAIDIFSTIQTLVQWFFIPFIFAVFLRLIVHANFPTMMQKYISRVIELGVTIALFFIVLFIFSFNIQTILTHKAVFGLILIAVFIFFVISYILGERVSKFFNFSYEDKVLYTMATSSRNAPLMLGITVAVLPEQPLIYAALIIGMLVEFPHLATVSNLLLRKQN